MRTVNLKDSTAHPFLFFGGVLAFSIPFYVWGVFWPVHGLPYGLPATAIMIIIPATVATVLTRRQRDSAAAWELWLRVIDVRRIASSWWLATALLFMPFVSLLSYAIMSALGLIMPSAMVYIPLAQTPVIFALYFFGAIFEEVGWTGYVTEPLQGRYGIFGAGVIIGSVWALWHVVPWWLGQGHPAWWVVAQAIATVAMRVVMGWMYAYGGRSLFTAIVFHAMINASFSLFPNEGSYYDPFVTAAVLIVIVGAILAFPLIRRPKLSTVSRLDGTRGSRQ